MCQCKVSHFLKQPESPTLRNGKKRSKDTIINLLNRPITLAIKDSEQTIKALNLTYERSENYDKRTCLDLI